VPLNTGGRRFERSATDKKIAGVCAGVARYFGMDVTLVRTLWIIFTIWPPPLGLIAYLICWAVMPVEPVRVAPTNEAQTV
jgi:phage shock protein C